MLHVGQLNAPLAIAYNGHTWKCEFFSTSVTSTSPSVVSVSAAFIPTYEPPITTAFFVDAVAILCEKDREIDESLRRASLVASATDSAS